MHCFSRSVYGLTLRGAALGLIALGLWCAAPSAAPASEGRYTAVVKAVQQASPSVVNIHWQKTVAAQAAPAAAGQTETVRRVNGMGTGVVIDERGYVLTNHHVVEGVSRIQVSLYDGRDVIAQLVGHDSATDLAIIKVNVADALPTLGLGTSSDLMTGEPVIAIGNAYGYEHTVTRGIVSAQHRTVQVSD